MPFLTIGVEHRTAPLVVRECVAMDPETITRVGVELHQHAAIDEVVILSTCNRTELYLYVSDPGAASVAVAGLLATCDARVAPYLHTWEEMEAVERLFRVASGLESQVLGEEQILGQVREAMEAAQRDRIIGPNLHSAFRAAIACARQARAGTALGRLDASVGSAAVSQAARELNGLEGKSALLIGGGEISRLVAAELRSHDVGRLYIANRTETVAVDLAARFGGQPVSLRDIIRVVPVIDLLISATSAPHYVVTAEECSPLLNHPSHKLHIYDLAVPRDVDPDVGSLPGITLHDLDSLLPSGLDEHWQTDIRAMEAIIAAERQEFTTWYLTRRVAPIIANLRSHVEAVSAQELKRVAPQLQDLTTRERVAVESLTNRLIDKMFHHLVMRLRFAAQTDTSLVEAAEFFFLHGEGGLFDHAAQQDDATRGLPATTHGGSEEE